VLEGTARGSSPPGAVVVSAHLDDAVLSCYSVLSPGVTVITVLAGFPPAGTLGPWDAAGGATDSAQRIGERRQEDRSALEHSGATPVHLEFADREYVALGVSTPPTVQAVSGSLRDYLADATVVFAPAAVSTNSANPLRRLRRRRRSDHRLVRDAVLTLRPDATLYADLPYALSPDRGFVLPRELDRTARRERRCELEATLLAEKLEAVRCYATQLDQLVDVFGDFVDEKSLKLEVFWEAPPGGALETA
jgi:LmbE family N-acetylglucosaminyl deacetylase